MKILLMTYLFSLLIYSQSNAQYVLSEKNIQLETVLESFDTNRSSNWRNSGVEKGLPEEYPVFVDGTTFAGENYSEKFNNAISYANEYSKNRGIKFVVVYIPEGSYEVHESLILKNNVVFKGAGSNKTFIKFTSNKKSNGYENAFIVHGNKSRASQKFTTEVADNLTNIGFTQDPIDFNIGNYIMIRDERKGAYGAQNIIPNLIGEVTKVVSVNENSFNVEENFSIDHFTYEKTAQKVDVIENVGIEDLTILMTHSSEEDPNDPNGGGDNISFRNAVNSWVRGVESIDPTANHIDISESAHLTISGSYFHHAQSYHGGHGYGIRIGDRSSRCLIEDNIFYHLRHAILFQTSANNNVVGYNYSHIRYDDVFLELASDKGDIALHGNYAHKNLFEGNDFEYINADGWFSSETNGYWTDNGPYNTFFRNRSRNTEITLCNADFSNVIAYDENSIDIDGPNQFYFNYDGSNNVYSIKEFIFSNNDSSSNTTQSYFPDISYYKTKIELIDLTGYDGPQFGIAATYVNSENQLNDIKNPNRYLPAEIRNSIVKKTVDSGVLISVTSIAYDDKIIENDLSKVYNFSLNQNYPNPFNPSTVISFSVKDYGQISLEVYDILGSKVSTLLNEFKEPGSYSYKFDASGLASGTYIYQFRSGNQVLSKKMNLVK